MSPAHNLPSNRDRENKKDRKSDLSMFKDRENLI
jgi:hypothetical protein